MPSSHLILCCPLLLLPPIPPVFPNLGLALGSPIFPSSCERKLGVALGSLQGCIQVSAVELTDTLELFITGRDWGQEEKGTTEDEMAGWHHADTRLGEVSWALQ